MADPLFKQYVFKEVADEADALARIPASDVRARARLGVHSSVFLDTYGSALVCVQLRDAENTSEEMQVGAALRGMRVESQTSKYARNEFMVRAWGTGDWPSADALLHFCWRAVPPFGGRIESGGSGRKRVSVYTD